jgi:cellulose synthase/poly-beta-1,6-N-acetylglucosamine synthase-like glycosyltransferase
MMPDLQTVLLVLTALLLWPTAVLVLEVLFALLPARRVPPYGAGSVRCAVLVPAHDEQLVLARTLFELKRQLHSRDRLIVIADNCTDGTADVARAGGAEVLERRDPDRRGKGYALDFGVRALAADPPDAVVVVDADCVVRTNALDALVRAAVLSGRPVQAAYTLDPLPGAGPRQLLAAFAFRVKNVVRPRGLDRLGLPCLLTGSGMAFPWAVIQSAPLAGGDIVEDMRLGVELALAGTPPLFCPEAEVAGEFPAEPAAADSQRRRWEHGHLRTLLRQVPRLAGAGFRRCRPSLLALALELSVPPLAFLFLLEGAALAVLALVAALGGPTLPFEVLAGGLAATTLAVVLAWAAFGSDRLPAVVLLAAPFYALAKLPLYLAFVVRPQRDWVRTARTPVAPAGPAGAGVPDARG